MNSNKLRFIICIGIALLVGYYVGITKIAFDWNNFQPNIQISSKEAPSSAQFGDAGRMWQVLTKLETLYYDKAAINADKVLNGAIAGMVSSLDDPYTIYLPPKQNDDFKQGLAGKFEGIGAELGMKGKDVIVVAPLDGGPAIKAGIKPGDVILKVNGQSIASLNISQVAEKIRGPKGTEVTVTVLHKGGKSASDVKIVRDTIVVKSLTTWSKKIKDIPNINHKDDGISQAGDQKIVYIRLSQFGDDTNSEWQKVATAVDRQLNADSGVTGIVLDLRNNPGGYLNDAVYISSEFIKDGDAVMQEDKNGKRTSYPVSGKGLLTEAEVVVLLNKGSASASEIVAGSLRDHKRAILVGESSFGKGTIQQAEDLGDGAGLHVTIAKWLTPNATWVGNGKNGTGLTPDVKVAVDTKNPTHDVQLEKAIGQLLK